MIRYLLILFSFFFHTVFADDTVLNIASLWQTDVSILILKTLFAGLPLFGSGVDGVQNIIQIFNGVCLAIGGILAGYNVFLTMISTANEGRALGGYSATMTPLRMSAGVIMVLPIFNG